MKPDKPPAFTKSHAALSGGKELVYLELQMYVGAKEPADTLALKGHPNISLVIPGGTHGDIATASVVVNSIPVISGCSRGLANGARFADRVLFAEREAVKLTDSAGEFSLCGPVHRRLREFLA